MKQGTRLVSMDTSHHFEEMCAFLRAVRTRKFQDLRSPYEDAAKSLAAVLAMNESMDSGKPVYVPQDF